MARAEPQVHTTLSLPSRSLLETFFLRPCKLHIRDPLKHIPSDTSPFLMHLTYRLPDRLTFFRFVGFSLVSRTIPPMGYSSTTVGSMEQPVLGGNPHHPWGRYDVVAIRDPLASRSVCSATVLRRNETAILLARRVGYRMLSANSPLSPPVVMAESRSVFSLLAHSGSQ